MYWSPCNLRFPKISQRFLWFNGFFLAYNYISYIQYPDNIYQFTFPVWMIYPICLIKSDCLKRSFLTWTSDWLYLLERARESKFWILTTRDEQFYFSSYDIACFHCQFSKHLFRIDTFWIQTNGLMDILTISFQLSKAFKIWYAYMYKWHNKEVVSIIWMEVMFFPYYLLSSLVLFTCKKSQIKYISKWTSFTPLLMPLKPSTGYL